MRRGFAAAPHIVALLAFLSPAAQAQTTVECATANSDGSYTVPADWALKPSGLAAGAKFRLLFVTSGTRNPQATGIATYNTYVQTSAKAGHSAITDSCGNLFKVVGSTSAVDARANTSTRSSDTDASIWWLTGAKAADNYADFYDGSWDSYAGKTESGNADPGDSFVWTGSNADGTRHATEHLGASGLVRAGNLGGSPSMSLTGNPNADPFHFYALSPVFSVASPPVPHVSVERKAATGASIVEGTSAVFTFTADWTGTRTTALKVVYAVVDELDTPLKGWNHFVPSANRGVQTIDIPAAGSVDLTVPTQADGTDLAGEIKVAMLGWGSDDAVTERYTTQRTRAGERCTRAARPSPARTTGCS